MVSHKTKLAEYYVSLKTAETYILKPDCIVATHVLLFRGYDKLRVETNIHFSIMKLLEHPELATSVCLEN